MEQENIRICFLIWPLFYVNYRSWSVIDNDSATKMRSISEKTSNLLNLLAWQVCRIPDRIHSGS